MSDVSRRSVLRGIGVTAAVVGAGAMVPGAALAAPGSATPRSTDEGGARDAATTSLIAYVEASTGEITLMSGDREVVVTDRRLAQRLARLAD